MRDFLVSNLFGLWILCCVLLIPRLTARPLIGATVVVLSGLLVLLALQQLGHGGFIVGGWAMYIPMVLIVAATVFWRVRRAQRQKRHNDAG